MKKAFSFVIFLILLSFNHEVHAHSRSESYSKWQEIDLHTVELRYTLKLADLAKMDSSFKTQLPGWQERVTQHVDQNVELWGSGEPCQSSSAMGFETQSNYLQLTKSFYCNNTNNLEIRNSAIFNIDSRHIHIARFTFINGSLVENVFLAGNRVWSPSQVSTSSSSKKDLFRFFVIGAEHIVTGWDHLSFLAAILLLVVISKASIKTLFVLVSGFTLGHSISLILTALGFFIPDRLSVEALIAFSIILIAMECIAYKTHSQFQFGLLFSTVLLFYLLASLFLFTSTLTTRSVTGLIIFVFCYFLLSSKTDFENNHKLHTQIFITLIFGFIHGFGFAGSLQEIGLPQEKLLSALIGFNLGVEAGQLLILLHVFLVFYLLSLLSKEIYLHSRMMRIREVCIELLCGGLCGLGVFWFIERSII